MSTNDIIDNKHEKLVDHLMWRRVCLSVEFNMGKYL